MDVLLVEDDVQVARLVGDVLRGRGHAVTTLADGASGLAAWATGRHPLVVLDWGLPGMDGLELCRRLRASPNGESAQVLMLTSRTAPGDLEEALAAGVDDYLAKPFVLGLLETRLAVAERGAAVRSERARAEEERARLDAELRAARDRLQQLLRTAMEMPLATSEERVFEVLGAAVVGVGLNAHAATIVEAPPEELWLEIRHVALTDRLQPAIERLLGRSIAGIRMDGGRVEPYAAVLREARLVQVEDTVGWLRRALPWVDERSARLIGRLRGVGQGVCAPITDGQRVLGALSVWGESLTDADLPTLGLLAHQAGTALSALRMRAAEADRARLDGAVKTSRLVAHELGNQLALVVGYGEHLALELTGAQAKYAEQILEGAEAAAETVGRLQQIMRFEETDIGGGPMLDLTAATRPPTT